jgi:hypothetical protein
LAGNGKGAGGRPRKELDAGAAFKLGQLGCTDVEILLPGLRGIFHVADSGDGLR